MTFFFINLNFRGTRPTVSISGFQVSTCSVEHCNSVLVLLCFRDYGLENLRIALQAAFE